MKCINAAALLICAMAFGGCYSSARHVANVRPDMIKPDKTLATKYRLERIVLKKSSFSRKVAEFKSDGLQQFAKRERELRDIESRMVSGDADAYVAFLAKQYPTLYPIGSKNSIAARSAFAAAKPNDRRKMLGYMISSAYSSIESERKACAELSKEDKKSGPNGTHYADTQMIFNSVCAALRRNYPSVFVDTANAIPLAVVIDWATEYKPLPDYASIFSEWLWPTAAEQETVYYMYLVENPGSRTDDELWNIYIAAPTKKYPVPPQCGHAVRTTEVWESCLLPTGFIPCPGDSDFPKTYCFMRSGKDSLVGAPSKKIESRECFKHMVFEPKVDGEVVAAAIMRAINRKHRIVEAASIMKEGAK